MDLFGRVHFWLYVYIYRYVWEQQPLFDPEVQVPLTAHLMQTQPLQGSVDQALKWLLTNRVSVTDSSARFNQSRGVTVNKAESVSAVHTSSNSREDSESKLETKRQIVAAWLVKQGTQRSFHYVHFLFAAALYNTCHYCRAARTVKYQIVGNALMQCIHPAELLPRQIQKVTRVYLQG